MSQIRNVGRIPLMLTLSTPFREWPPGWRWVAVAIGLGLLASPFCLDAWLFGMEEFNFWHIKMHWVWHGPLLVAYAIILLLSKRRPFFLLVLGVVTLVGAGYLFYQSGYWQPALWQGTRVPVQASIQVNQWVAWAPFVISSQVELDRFSSKYREALPQDIGVDFSKQMLVVAYNNRWARDAEPDVRLRNHELQILSIQKRWLHRDACWEDLYTAGTRAFVLERTDAPPRLIHVEVRSFGKRNLKDWFESWWYTGTCYGLSPLHRYPLAP